MKKIFIPLMIFALSVLNSLPMYSFSGWNLIDGEYVYLNNAGQKPQNAWMRAGDNLYYLGSDGFIVKNCIFEYDNELVFVDKDGKKVINTFMYIDNSVSKSEDIKEGLYYFDERGCALRKTNEFNFKKYINGVYYAFDEDGLLQEGWFNKEGERLTDEAEYLTEGTITYPYSESDEKLKGSGIITLESAKQFKYTKIQKVTVTSNIDTTYNKVFYVNNNAFLNSATNYASDLQGKLVNYWIPNTNTSGNTFNDKEYLYEGTKDANNNVFYATATNVKKDMAVEFYHSLNQDREDKKILLNNELTAADTKLTTLTSAIAIASLTNAINTANTVKVNQRNKTVDELYAAYLALKEAVDTAVDPPMPPGTTITIAINGNGGTTNVTEIYETIGNQYNELSTVTASRDGYTFNRWSTAADGSGQTITPDMTVSDTSYPTELFAIWSQNVAPTPTRRFSGGVSGGGGGGGGGRNHVDSNYSALPVLDQNHNFRSFEKNISNTVFGNSLYFKDNDHYQTYFAYDPITNSYTLSVINKGTAEKVKNQWATVGKTINGVEMTCAYKFDENGNARTGFYTEGNDVYYFNRTMGEDYASLQIGWIYDTTIGKYYYANPYSGALCVGWTNIDGKDYYFTDTKSLDAAGNLNINNANAIEGYGQMLSNCVTPDGYRVDATGARIIEQPN